jgi:predicted RNA-binding Zn ribbon-like protein
VQLINEVAVASAPVPQLTRQAVTWLTPVRGAACLSAIARDAIELFGGHETQRVRECANPRCALLFMDSSRPGTRRWCSMRRCGNRSKAALYRERIAAE